jgi:hypothetical protein
VAVAAHGDYIVLKWQAHTRFYVDNEKLSAVPPARSSSAAAEEALQYLLTPQGVF